ncbi:hypothetical protein EDB87DRAFT_1577962 [Lactarius vividus]|nr:hypothetical protein EDB87DRAFT_1577962 [Lactarius vividus]
MAEEVKRRRAKIFARKLLGRTDSEDALKRLESLIQEEFQMVTAQILKVATEAKKNDADKANIVIQQDMEEVKRDVLEVKRDVVEVKSDVVGVKSDVVEVKSGVEEVKCSPSPTHLMSAIETQFLSRDTDRTGHPQMVFSTGPVHKLQYCVKGPARGNGRVVFSRRGIHEVVVNRFTTLDSRKTGGSGKSILWFVIFQQSSLMTGTHNDRSSAIIKYVMSLRDAGQTALAFFHFDFRDKDKKQDFRNFITSLLVQLSAYSSLCCKIISDIYSTHGKGTQQLSNNALKDCLRQMLLTAAEQPIYVIVDALDECPNASGMPIPREVVLDLLEGLVRLGLAYLCYQPPGGRYQKCPWATG